MWPLGLLFQSAIGFYYFVSWFFVFEDFTVWLSCLSLHICTVFLYKWVLWLQGLLFCFWFCDTAIVCVYVWMCVRFIMKLLYSALLQLLNQWSLLNYAICHLHTLFLYLLFNHLLWWFLVGHKNMVFAFKTAWEPFAWQTSN
jgi:hypothetical protein